MIERDIAKIATLLVIGAILVNIGTHGSVFVSLTSTIGSIFNTGLRTAAGK